MKALPYTIFLCGFYCGLPSTAAANGPEWSSYPRLDGVGAHGIVLADFEGNGYKRIVATARRASGLLLFGSAMAVYDDSAGDLALEQLVHFAPETRVYGSIMIYRLPGQQRDLVGLSVGSEFVTYGDWPLRKIHSVPLPSPQTQVTSVYDLDGDGALELLGLTEPFTALDCGSPFVASAADGDIIWNDISVEAHDVAAGHVGTLAEPVIVISSFNGPGPGLVLSGPTRDTVWTWAHGFHGKIRLGNYESDAADEFAVITHGGETEIYSASPSFSKVSQFSTGTIGQVRENHDLDGDGYDEILIGENSWGSIKAFNARSGGNIASFSGPERGVAALTVGKLGISDTLTLVHGSGFASSGPDALRVIETANANVVHALIDEEGPYSASTLLKRADGSELVAYATIRSRAEFEGSAIYLLNPDSGEIIEALEPSTAFQSRRRMRLMAANLDQDPQDELIVYSEASSSGYIAARDGETFDLQWETSIPDFRAVEDALVADIDGNGSLEIVATAGGRVYFIDGTDGSILWSSISFTAVGFSSLSYGPVMANGEPGVAYIKGDRIYIIDPIKRVVDRATSLEEAPIDHEVYSNAVHCEHRLYYTDRAERRNCASGSTEQTRNLVANASMIRIPGAFDHRIFISDGRSLLMQLGDEIVKRASNIDVQLGYDNLGVYRTDGDIFQIFIGGDFGFHRIDFGSEIFVDGFEEK